ncbi:beta-galactosidase [Pseudopelagicola sp. nBUS_19]|uniref:beta-galactosidase n=1 Tax=unclassified Pseudopelagicola TaxID=2649563 RepID=UPI003EBF80FB
MKPELGVCYYPEHWPEEIWPNDAKRMVEAGIRWVRIGEFAWSRIEVRPGQLTLEWLDRAIDVLGNAGLKVVLGTPTATPPRWMLDKYPDMVAVAAEGQVRKFGSRRHYCFSHVGYRKECARIVEILGVRYGSNPHVVAWQTDNEYGCHDTVVSYSDAALASFRIWLTRRYGTIEALNAAWGNVFWSMEYDAFEQIDLPNLTVTEPNPAHVLAFKRFSSDQVVTFNLMQVEILRAHSDAALIHNYMGRILEFDHFEVGAELDIASWDSYPIGFLSDRLEASEEHKSAFLRQGDPDMQAFHHDLYRAVGRGRWWVMEQQPGPVNWAPYNPAPLPGMVALWSLEAIAHGAEVVSYFRWRQVPFGQEQNHTGLLHSDGRAAAGLKEARFVADIIASLSEEKTRQAAVAMVFDYASEWAWDTQPQGQGFQYFRLVFAAYKALRRAGLSVDIVPSSAKDLRGYNLVLAPGLATVPSELVVAAENAGASFVLGPRSGAITEEFSIPAAGRPGVSGLDVNVEVTESLPPGQLELVDGGGAVHLWWEHLTGDAIVKLRHVNGAPLLMYSDGLWYLGGFPDESLWDRVVKMVCNAAKITTRLMPSGLRSRQLGDLEFLINYNAHLVELNHTTVPAAGVIVMRDGDVVAASNFD